MKIIKRHSRFTSKLMIALIFVALAVVNLLARDIYDNRAIANLSFYTSDILRKKWSYIRFLVVYLFVALVFTALMAGILFLQRNLVTYNVWTNLGSIGLLLVQTFVLLAYILFSNIALQGYAFNRIIGLWRTLGKIGSFIVQNFTNLTLLSIITILFSNLIAYIAQGILTFLIIKKKKEKFLNQNNRPFSAMNVI